MSNAVLAVAVSDIRDTCEGEPDVVKRLEKAMRKAQHFWMSTDDDLRLRAACGAAMITGPDEDKDRITRSLGAMRALIAMMSGVSVDMERETEKAGEDAIPIVKMWQDAKAAEASR